jgi:hypothetical protein
MEKSNLPYEKIISALRETQPQIRESEFLTEKIVGVVKNERREGKIRVVTFFRPALSAAAVLLIGLFFFETTNNPADLQLSIKNNSNSIVVKKQKFTEHSIMKKGLWQIIGENVSEPANRELINEKLIRRYAGN